jgi:ubiquinone/menaquinone biosynthesis C-methylase UbiE
MGDNSMASQTKSATDDYQELVEAEWTDPATVAAWDHWSVKQLVLYRDATALLLRLAGIRPGMTVLDLASGTGDPALALAEAVGPTGRVTATDLSTEMVRVCTATFQKRGVTNAEVIQADAQALPFPDGSFDAVTSKLGAMYFVGVQRALGEIRRVLKPGGRVALLVWGPPDESPYVQLLLGPIFARVELPPLPTDMPHPLRFAQTGLLAAELERAGFRDVAEATHIVPMRWPGPPEEFWQSFYDVAVPMRPLIDGLPSDERQAAIGEILEGLRALYDGAYTTTPCAFAIATAIR